MAQSFSDSNREADLANAFYTKGRKHWNNGEREEAITLFRKALALQETSLGTYHKNTARTYYWVGFALTHREEYDKALVAYRRTLRIRILLYGVDDISTEDVLRALKEVLRKLDYSNVEVIDYLAAVSKSVEHEQNGNLAAEKGDYNEAISEYEECLSIEEASEGMFPMDAAELRSKIAQVYVHKKEYDMALDSYREALILYEPKLGREHPDTVKCLKGIEVACNQKRLDPKTVREYMTSVFDSIALVNKGDKRNREGLYEKAIKAFELAIKVEEATLGRDPLTTAEIQVRVASTSSALEDYDRSILALRTALTIFIISCGRKHNKVTAVLKKIHQVLTIKGFDTSAADKYVKTVIYSIRYERNAENVNRQGRYAVALEEFQKGLSLEVESLGKYHLTQAALFRGMGNSYIGIGKFDDAIANYRNALLIQYPALGLEHDATQKTIRRLVYAAQDKGMSESLVKEYREGVILSVESEVGGDAALAEGYPEKAVTSFSRAIAIEESLLGHFHLCTLDLYSKIAIALKVHGDTNRAVSAHRDILTLNQRLHGSDHPDTELAMVQLQNIAKLNGMSESEASEYCQKAVLAIRFEQAGDELVKSKSFDRAIKQYQRAIELETSSLGENHLTTATLSGKIGDSYHFQGMNIDAVLMYRKSIKINQGFGNSHGSENTALNLGVAIEDLGFVDSTAKKYQKEIWNAIAHEHEGDRSWESGNSDQAISEYRKAVSIEETGVVKLFVTTESLYRKLAEICHEKEDYESSVLFYSKVVAIQEAYFGKANPDTLRSFNDLILMSTKLTTRKEGGLQGWATLKFILTGLIGLLVMIMTVVKTLSKTEAPIKKLRIAAYDNEEAPSRTPNRVRPIISLREEQPYRKIRAKGEKNTDSKPTQEESHSPGGNEQDPKKPEPKISTGESTLFDPSGDYTFSFGAKEPETKDLEPPLPEQADLEASETKSISEEIAADGREAVAGELEWDDTNEDKAAADVLSVHSEGEKTSTSGDRVESAQIVDDEESETKPESQELKESPVGPDPSNIVSQVDEDRSQAEESTSSTKKMVSKPILRTSRFAQPRRRSQALEEMAQKYLSQAHGLDDDERSRTD